MRDQTVSLDLMHTEASFSPNSIDLLCLRVAQTPTSRDMAIFVLMTTTMTMTQPITLPLAHARRVMISDEGMRRKVWERVLGWDYRAPSSYIDEVYSKYSTAKEKIHALADVYVNITPESSWQNLVQTLYEESEMAAAKEAKSIFQEIGGIL